MGFAIPLLTTIGSAAAGEFAAAGAGAGGLAGIGSSVLGTGISALGSIVSGFASAGSDRANAAILANNAKIAQRNASMAAEEGEVKAGEQQAKNRAKMGGIVAEQGGSGIDVNSGSFTNVKAGQELLGQTDTTNIKAAAARQAYGFQTEAASDLASAANLRSKAEGDIFGGVVGGGDTLLGGIGKAGEAYDQWKYYGGGQQDQMSVG